MIIKYLNIVAIIILLASVSYLKGQTNKPDEKPDNSGCLKCHGKSYYKFQNTVTEKEVHKKMNPFFLINSKKYDGGVHKTFACTDCHLPDYETYPHDANLKLEANSTCQDCHAGDDNFKHFKFDEIDVIVQNSIHGKAMGEYFNCEMCHDPHYYELNARKKKNIEQIVDYSNQMCLKCHDYGNDKFFMLGDTTMSINQNSHGWLPNQMLHFQKVRCVDCHGAYDDSLMVPHLINSKDKAVKLCVECHSDNSLLMTSLYRHQSKESRDKYGFFNGAMMNDSFVLGANRNYFLNAASIGIFSLVLLIILAHALLRIILKK